MRVLDANLCYNHLNKTRLKEAPLEDEPETLPEKSSQNPDALLELNQEHQDLYQKIWQLPENQRIALSCATS